MSNNSDKFDGFSAFVGMVISGMVCVLFFTIIIQDINNSWRKEAIQTNNAKYNEKTSSFEWIDHSIHTEHLSEKDE